MSMQGINLWLNRFAMLTAAATVGLIVAGAVVTSTESGDAIPDWPLSYGMLFPPMVGGIFYEHTHRMAAGLTGVLIVILALWLWSKEPRRWVCWLGFGATLIVVAQALLGGLRVLVISYEPLQEMALNVTGTSHITPVRIAFAVAHAFLAQIILCLTFALATITSPSWLNAGGPIEPDSHDCASHKLLPHLNFLTIFVLVLIFAQLLVGALMRHIGAGLAIPDFPLSFGHLIPSFTNLPYDQNTSFQMTYEELKIKVLIHFVHRVGALVVALAIIYLLGRIFRHYRSEGPLIKLAIVLVGLTVVQITLGAFVIWTQKAIFITVAHVTFGALMLGTSVMFWLWALLQKRSLGKRSAGVYPRLFQAGGKPGATFKKLRNCWSSEVKVD